MADGRGKQGAPKEQQKRGPEWKVRIPLGPDRLHRETAFLCNIRFKNDLPEIPCDPKLLLQPYDKEKIAAFKLTELEKDLKKDLLFEPDLGIPIHPWNIEQYSIPEVVPPLHPDDAALVQSDEELEPQRARLRGDAAELSWLLRTKYIAAEAGLKRGGLGNGTSAGLAKKKEESENEDPHAARLRQIEEQFAAAKAPPVHGRDPSIVPVEVMPVFPDTLMEGHSCVLATFDADPLAESEQLEGLPPDQRARLPQVMQLKAFRPSAGPQFVALLVPKNMPQPGDDELSAAGGIPGFQLAREYQWVREYNPTPRLDEKSSTYLFRFANDGTVRFHDLNTALALRKRKRQAAGADGEEEGESFVQPEMVVVRRLDTLEYAEEQQRQRQRGGEAEGGEEDDEAPAKRRQRIVGDAAGDSDDSRQQQQQHQRHQDGREGEEEDVGPAGDGGGGGGGRDGEMGDGEGGGSEEQGQGGDGGRMDANATLRDVFGDDDDDI